MRKSARTVLALLALAAMVASQAHAENGGVSVSGQWLRALGGDLPAAGYFTLRNETAHVVRLTGAASPSCASLTLHQTVRQHTMSAMSAMAPENAGHGMAPMSTMQPVDAIAVPASGTIRFAPGSYHLMCDHPAASVQPGQSIAVTLHLEGERDLVSVFPIKGPRAQ